MSWREEDLVSWCDSGFRVGLREHLTSVAEVLMGVERLWSPVVSADKALSALMRHEGVVASAAVAAALLHDLGKAHEGFVRACAESGATGFRYHEVVGAYLLFQVGEDAGPEGVTRSAAYLASYAVLAHHHAMRGRGLEVVRGGGEVPDTEFIIPRAAAEAVRRALDDIAPKIIPPADDALVRAVVDGAVSFIGSGARIPLRRAVKVMRSVKVPRVRAPAAVSPARVKAALFSNLPAAAYFVGNVVRRAGFTLAGVLAAADTLAASVERGSCSVFCLRLVRELLGG